MFIPPPQLHFRLGVGNVEEVREVPTTICVIFSLRPKA
jgi:hypothetical protein